MQLNTLFPAKGSKRFHKRVGRGIGSGLGKTSGRGHKGQKSRSGGNVNRGFEGGQMPLYRRLPKFGFSSMKSLITKEVRLCSLNHVDSKIINLDILKKHGIVGSRVKFAKIILFGKVEHQITVCGIKVSKGARIIIESLGGKIE